MDEAVQNKDFLKAQNIKMEMEKLDIEQNQLQEELTEATAMAAMPNSADTSKQVSSSKRKTEYSLNNFQEKLGLESRYQNFFGDL